MSDNQEFLSQIQMELQNILKLDLSLQKLSAIATAVKYWELPEVKRKIYQFVNSDSLKGGPVYKRGIDDTQVLWSNQINKYVVDLVDSSGAPSRITDYIKNYVFTIGRLIFGFNVHIKSNDCDINFGLNISWLPYGRIDEVKMAREWLRKPSGNLNCLCLPDLYAEEDLIRTSMLNVKERISAEMKVGKLASLDKKFLFCFENLKYLFALRYFWNELDIKEKKKHVGYAVSACSCARSLLDTDNVYQKQKLTELLLFFWKEISIISSSSPCYTTLFEALLKAWPYRELIPNIIENHSQNFQRSEFNKCLDLVTSCVLRELEENVVINENRDDYRVILRKLIENIPKQIKLKYYRKKFPVFSSFHGYFHYVSILANDASFKELRPDIISKGKYFFEKSVSCGNYSDLDNYTQHLAFDEEEVKLFKHKLNRMHKLVTEGKFEMATQNINWICETQMQINEMKRQIDPEYLRKFLNEGKFDLAEKFVAWRYDTKTNQTMDPVEFLCTHLIKENQFDSILKYLTWRFENEEELEKVKNALYARERTDPVDFCRELINENKFEEVEKYLTWRFGNEEEVRNVKKIINTSDVYLRDKIYGIWLGIGSYEEALRKCESFLKLFLESDEAVKEFTTNKLFEKESYLQMFGDAPFWICEDFLKFCYLTPEKIDEMMEERAKSVCVLDFKKILGRDLVQVKPS